MLNEMYIQISKVSSGILRSCFYKCRFYAAKNTCNVKIYEILKAEITLDSNRQLKTVNFLLLTIHSTSYNCYGYKDTVILYRPTYEIAYAKIMK